MPLPVAVEWLPLEGELRWRQAAPAASVRRPAGGAAAYSAPPALSLPGLDGARKGKLPVCSRAESRGRAPTTWFEV